MYREKIDRRYVQEPIDQEPREHRVKFDINNVLDGKHEHLYANLALPSYVHGYSLAIEYMSKWFEKGFDENHGFKKDFFNSVYIDGKHVLDDYKKFSKMIVKGENPRARIEPRVQFDYDMETVDLYQAPPSVFIRRSPYQDSFFKDYERNIFLGVQVRALRMDFNFKVRVNTRSQQLDTFNKMELNFRIKATQAEEVSVDFHVPMETMLQIADMAGFAIKDGVILNTIEFIEYLNAHSQVPFLFKIRAINKHPEFFIRITREYVRIMIPDNIQMDDGERDGKLDFNFHLEMNATLIMPIPHFYVLYAARDHQGGVMVREPDKGTKPIYTINLIDIPKMDEHGWNQACLTDCLVEKEEDFIDISELFSGDNVLRKVIHHDLLKGVSPAHFMNIRVYRDEDVARVVPIKMDWKNLKIHFKPLGVEEVLHIVIYYDRQYINELEINIHQYQDDRVQSKHIDKESIFP